MSWDSRKGTCDCVITHDGRKLHEYIPRICQNWKPESVSAERKV